MLGHLAPNRYEVDLSNDVLYALLDQGAAKISEAKVGGRKRNCQLGWIGIRRTRGKAELADFYDF